MGRRRPGYSAEHAVRRWRRGPVKAMFATYAVLIVLGLAYFVALGVANR
jgi:hypothetical protein